MTGVDVDISAHPRTQDRGAGLLLDADAHRDALHDLDQLPLVFSGGNTENSELLAGLMASTTPDQV